MEALKYQSKPKRSRRPIKALTPSQQELAESNILFAYSRAYQWYKKVGTYLEWEDIVSCCTMGIVKAARSYKVEKGLAFTTYAGISIDNELKQLFRYNSMNGRDKVLPESSINIVNQANGDQMDDSIILDRLSGGEEDKYNFMDADLVEYLLSKLDLQERTVIQMMYFDEKKYMQHEIAEILGVSQTWVSRLHNRTLVRMKKLLSEKGIRAEDVI